MNGDLLQKFTGKVVIITGASSGIGRTIAIQFSKLGASLVLNGRNMENLNETKQKCMKYNSEECLLVSGDLTEENTSHKIVSESISHFGQIDVLVNNAGIYETDTIQKANLDVFDRIFNTNLRSIYLLTHLSIPYLSKTRGSIINISSLVAIRPFPWCLSYTMSKAALDQFTKCIALELAEKNIRVNSVNPGSVMTEKKMALRGAEMEKFMEKCKEVHPLGRAANMEEVANVVVWLAGGDAGFITGVNVPVDGGRNVACPR